MRFLLDANMPRCAVAIVEARGNQALFIRDMGLGQASDSIVADLCKRNDAVLVTRDFDFSDIRNDPPAEFPGIVIMDLPEDATASRICAVLKTFMDRPELEAEIRNHLAIARPGRVRFRPALRS